MVYRQSCVLLGGGGGDIAWGRTAVVHYCTAGISSFDSEIDPEICHYSFVDVGVCWESLSAAMWPEATPAIRCSYAVMFL